MDITTTIKVEWDRDKESLAQFRGKFTSFKQHINSLQVSGNLPRGAVRWLVSKKRDEMVVPKVEHEMGIVVPMMSHEAGEMLR